MDLFTTCVAIDEPSSSCSGTGTDSQGDLIMRRAAAAWATSLIGWSTWSLFRLELTQTASPSKPAPVHHHTFLFCTGASRHHQRASTDSETLETPTGASFQVSTKPEHADAFRVRGLWIGWRNSA